jgi:adenine deaminase
VEEDLVIHKHIYNFRIRSKKKKVQRLCLGFSRDHRRICLCKMTDNSSILLLNGTVLVLNEQGTVVPLRDHSVLIEGNRISKIGPDLTAPSLSTKVIDCTDKIISPGFIDTHHHLWQSQLKGRHADHTLIEYIPTGWVTFFLVSIEH